MVRSFLPSILALCCILLQVAPVQLDEVKQLGSSSFYIGESLLNWNAAAKACEPRRLVHLDNIKKMGRLSYELTNRGIGHGGEFWIGGTDVDTPGKFYWADGKIPFKFTAWGGGQPDNANDNEHCVTLFIGGGVFIWNDLICTDTKNFICEDTRRVPMKRLGSSPFYLSETNSKLSWADAAASCEERQLRLAQLNTRAKHDQLTSELTQHGVPNDAQLWIEGTDVDTPGYFYWADRKRSFNFTAWAQGQPNNHNNNEHCVILYNNAGNFEWHDLICEAPSQFICEE